MNTKEKTMSDALPGSDYIDTAAVLAMKPEESESLAATLRVTLMCTSEPERCKRLRRTS